MARVHSVSLSESEAKEIDRFLDEKKMNMNQLLKQAAMEYISKFQTPDKIPAHLQRLIDDLESWKRWKYPRTQNVTWLTGRHGVTSVTAEKALDLFEKDAMVL